MVVQEESLQIVSLLTYKDITGDFATADAFSEVHGCVKVV